MKRTLALLLLVATSALGQSPSNPSPKREVFPSDYKPAPCAPNTAAICGSFDRTVLPRAATAARAFDLDSTWLDAHWDEMVKVFQPFCAKIASCYTVPGNDPIFCVDIMRDDFLSSCSRFPAGSHDEDECKKFTMTYFIGLGLKKDLFNEAQTCARSAQTPALRTMEAWIDPGTMPVDFSGDVTVSAYDSETHIPIRAGYSIDAGDLLSSEGPLPTGGYPARWSGKLKRVANAEGHYDVVPPTITLDFPGYQTLRVPLGIQMSKMVAEMTPAASQLKRGTNTITVSVRDANTGKPVEARVMADSRALGRSNKPLELELAAGERVPEIWITSLYDRYSDVVVSKAGGIIK